MPLQTLRLLVKCLFYLSSRSIHISNIFFSWLHDTTAAIEKHYPYDSWTEVGTNVYGCVKQLYLLKKNNRHLKTLLSIGGWTYASNFAPWAATALGRAKFASSAIELVQNLGFDGIDIDWEYPAIGTKQPNDLLLLLQTVRQGLDNYKLKNNFTYDFLLSLASPAGPANYNLLQLKEMDKYLDMWNLMAFDYSGSFSTFAGHQSNLHLSKSNPLATHDSTDTAVKDYIAAGINASKIQLGMPLYGRSFEQTAGLGKPFNGTGGGSWEPGSWDYKALPKAGATVMTDTESVASYSYDSATHELITYDTIGIVKQKATYIMQEKLGGGMFWELSADRTGDLSIVGTIADQLGTLNKSQNMLNYPLSIYDNMRTGMRNMTAGIPGATVL